MRSIFEKINADYNLFVSEKKKVAESARRYFLDAKFSNLKDSGKLVEFMIKFSRCYKALIFFPDKDVLDKIKGFNVPRHLFIPFVDMSEISHELFDLEKHNIFSTKLETLYFIDMYLDLLIGANTHRWYYNLIGKDDAECLRYYKNIGRRIDYGIKNGKELDAFDEIFSEDIMAPNASIEQFTGKNMIAKAYSGTADWVLPYIFSFFFYYKDSLVSFDQLSSTLNISQNEFLRRLFNFFKLFVQNKSMLTEEEFNQRTDMRYANYDSYKAQRMKKIVVRCSSKFGSVDF